MEPKIGALASVGDLPEPDERDGHNEYCPMFENSRSLCLCAELDAADLADVEEALADDRRKYIEVGAE